MLKIYVVKAPSYDWHDGSFNIGFFQTLEGALDAAHAHWLDTSGDTIPVCGLVEVKDDAGNIGLIIDDKDGDTLDADDIYTSYCAYVISKVEVK